METLKTILIIGAALIVGGAFVLGIVALITSRIYSEVESRFDNVDEYEASLSGLTVEEIKEQNKNIKRGVKK